jgi:hypothetical protein
MGLQAHPPQKNVPNAVSIAFGISRQININYLIALREVRYGLESNSNIPLRYSYLKRHSSILSGFWPPLRYPSGELYFLQPVVSGFMAYTH